MILATILVFSSLSAQIPNGYYHDAIGKDGAQLLYALTDIIDDNSTLDYGDLHSYFQQTDKTGDNHVWDMYSFVFGSSQNYQYTFGTHECDAGLQYNSEGDCFNREHLWPQSYFNQAYPMRADMHMVIPTDGWVNNKRSNLPFGNVNTANWTSTNGSKKGTSSDYSGYSGDVFEPIDSFKGDIARAMLYTSVRYYNVGTGWTNWEMADGAVLNGDALQVLRVWHDMDPVSQKEIDRNNAVYAIQGNRNPFIDHPLFVECIWGTQCTPLSINNTEEKNEILLSSGDLQLQDRSIMDRVFIYDTTGILVLKQNRKKRVSIQNLEAGIYLVQVHKDGKIFAQKFVKP